VLRFSGYDYYTVTKKVVGVFVRFRAPLHEGINAQFSIPAEPV
jgi:hypothetical protein